MRLSKLESGYDSRESWFSRIDSAIPAQKQCVFCLLVRQRFGVHTLRHSYRSWLDAVGTEIAVQQKLMRHADIRTTMSYGDVVTNQESEALAKVAALTLAQQHATARSTN